MKDLLFKRLYYAIIVLCILCIVVLFLKNAKLRKMIYKENDELITSYKRYHNLRCNYINLLTLGKIKLKENMVFYTHSGNSIMINKLPRKCLCIRFSPNVCEGCTRQLLKELLKITTKLNIYLIVPRYEVIDFYSEINKTYTNVTVLGVDEGNWNYTSIYDENPFYFVLDNYLVKDVFIPTSGDINFADTYLKKVLIKYELDDTRTCYSIGE